MDQDHEKLVLVQEIPSVKLLNNLNLIDKEHLQFIELFIVKLKRKIQEEGDSLLKESSKVTLKTKLGNSVGASCFGSKFANSPDKNMLNQRGDLILALMSIQFLADLGDTLIDSKRSELSSDKLIKKASEVYSLEASTEKSKVLNFLKEAIQNGIKEEASISALFNQRWLEFIEYQNASLITSYNLFSEFAETMLSKFEQDRLSKKLPPSFNSEGFSSVEKFYSKGGTITLLCLLREASLNVEARSNIKTVELVSSVMDVINFASDHFADLLEDHIGNQQRLFESLLNKIFMRRVQRNLNAVHAEVMQRYNLSNGIEESLYLNKALGYYLDLIDRVDRMIELNWKDSPCSYLLSPMIMYFFMDGKSPTPELNTAVNKKAISLLKVNQ